MAVIAERVLDARSATDAPRLASFIGGRYDADASGVEIPVTDPATGNVIARIVDAGPAGVERAVAAGRAAYPKWRAVAPRDRAALIGELAQRIEKNAERLA